MEQELSELRGVAATDYSAEVLDRLRDVEVRVREISRLDAIKWRKRSRIWWLSLGEAPTRYFFALFRARCSRETLHDIRIDEETSTSSDGETRSHIHSYYWELFTSDPQVVGNQVERVAVLSLITKKVSQLENDRLIRCPNHLEIKKVVFSFHNEKSPGLDGITTEVLHKCWPFIQRACYEMVEVFWLDRIMPLSSLAGVIKLIPKDGDLSWLTNWRPITMITMTYKIISKILANRVKSLIPHLVDSQQTGFVPDQSITNNLLAFRLDEEYTQSSKQQITLLKVDFYKAFGWNTFSCGTLWPLWGLIGDSFVSSRVWLKRVFPRCTLMGFSLWTSP